jgi:hypothetical protein
MKKLNSSKIKVAFLMWVMFALPLVLTIKSPQQALAQVELKDQNAAETNIRHSSSIEVITPNYAIQHLTLDDGTPVLGHIINGPSDPPVELSFERAASIQSNTGAILLPDFPSYDWVFGCSAVSGAMIAGYYDRNGYPNMYTGPTNGGVMPLSDTSWARWSDGYTTYPNNPLIASRIGVDGRTTRGSIDNYWTRYGSSATDPYLTNKWPQHNWGTAVGDFMKTSQSGYSNTDGSTVFYSYDKSSSKLSCSTMASFGVADQDGTYGRKLFFEARGYKVTDCYNQPTDNNIAGGFSLADFQAEINAGHPVLLNLAGHSIVGYGYSGSTIYIRDTWDNNPSRTYTMTWGGVYQNMRLLSVSVVHLEDPPATEYRVVLPMILSSPVSNQAPTNLAISNSSIAENALVNTIVGEFSTTDPDAGDLFTYSLVSGAGDSDNSSFNISGTQLRSSSLFDYDTKNSYSVRVRTTDQGGLFFEKSFTITIIDARKDSVISNGNFELGRTGWTESSSNGFDLILQESKDTPVAYAGEWYTWLGGYYDEVSSIVQKITVPVDMPYLQYWYLSQSQDDCGNAHLWIKVGATTVETQSLCNSQKPNEWAQAVLDLSAYAGMTIDLKFEASTDSNSISNLFLDDIHFTNSALLAPNQEISNNSFLLAPLKKR